MLARRKDRLLELDLPDTICEKVDITNIDAIREAVQKAEDKFGPVDCLINNAGIMLLGLVWEQDPSEWQRMVDINVVGLLNGIHVVLKDMIDRQKGTIINISSIAGRKTYPNHAVYCGTKFAVHAMSENIREEVADKNVRVITIAPGPVETELLSHTSKTTALKHLENRTHCMFFS